MSQEDDASVTLSVDASEKTVTFRGRKLETIHLALILAAIVLITFGAFYFGAV